MLKIDLKDRKILYELDLNCRQSNTQIGKNVGSVLKFVSGFGIIRFTCEDASLEEIFLQYYE